MAQHGELAKFQWTWHADYLSGATWQGQGGACHWAVGTSALPCHKNTHKAASPPEKYQWKGFAPPVVEVPSADSDLEGEQRKAGSTPPPEHTQL